MGDATVDLELVVSADRDLTVPASELRRLAALPGQRVRVRIERADPVPVRSLMGVYSRPGAPRLELDDFDDLRDDVWGGTGYGRS